MINLRKKIIVKKHKCFITDSIGIALSPDHGSNFEEIFMFAEIAMNKAKKSGKNRFALFNKKMDLEIMDRLSMEKSLYEAVENCEFTVAYQFQKDLNTNSFTGAEALVRWRHPEKGLIPNFLH